MQSVYFESCGKKMVQEFIDSADSFSENNNKKKSINYVSLYIH